MQLPYNNLATYTDYRQAVAEKITVQAYGSATTAASSHRLERSLGVTYKTAWFMWHRIREAMTGSPSGLLGSGSGTVERTEGLLGQQRATQALKGSRLCP